MKKQYEEDYANMGLIALKRASRKVLEKAYYDNLRVPIWRNGKIEYISKEIKEGKSLSHGKHELIEYIDKKGQKSEGLL